MKNIYYFLLFISLIISGTINGQNVFTVTKTSDPDPFDHPYSYVDALCDTAIYGTLQWAIRKTNDAPPPSEIRFNIPGTGQHTIYLNYVLPPVNKQVSIDGSTQPGYNYTNGPSVIIDGTNIPIYNHCINFTANDDSSTVKGIHIQNFWASTGVTVWTGNVKIKDCMFWNVGGQVWPWRNMGVYIAAPNAIVQGNIFGTDVSGTQNHGCSAEAIYLQSQYLPADNCIIGGSGLNEGNLIAFSGWNGITVVNGKYNKISRNRIYNNAGGIFLLIYAGPDWWGNEAKSSPIIDSLTPTGILYGTSQPNDVIEIFGSTGSQNANEYLITTTADGLGNWTAVMSSFNLPYFIATATDASNNTSELSDAYEVIIPPITISFSKTDASCNGAGDGSAEVIVSGGILPYSYLWSNGQNTSIITNLEAGVYTVTVTDSINNIAFDTVVINEPPLDTLYTSATCSDLFISEYLEGSVHNTALEIYNPTDSIIILNRYFLRMFTNGAPTPLIHQLIGLIYPGGTFVIANPNADLNILTASDQTSNKINFNGDDPIQFIKVLNNININIDSIEGHGGNPHDIFDTLQLDTLDQIGIPGVDPGNQGYSVGDSGTTKNSTLRRNAGVTSGTRDWTCGQKQWRVFGQDDVSGLGPHDNICKINKVTVKFELSQSPDAIEGTTHTVIVNILLSGTIDGNGWIHVFMKTAGKCIDPPDDADCGTDKDYTITGGWRLPFGVYDYNNSCPSSNYWQEDIPDTFNLGYFFFTVNINDDGILDEEDEGICFKITGCSNNITIDKDNDTHLIMIINNPSPAQVQDVNSTDKIKIFPTLVDENLNIEGIDDELNLTITFQNVLGETVIAKPINMGHGKISVNTSSLSSGMYFINLMTSDGIITKKFIKL